MACHVLPSLFFFLLHHSMTPNTNFVFSFSFSLAGKVEAWLGVFVRWVAGDVIEEARCGGTAINVVVGAWWQRVKQWCMSRCHQIESWLNNRLNFSPNTTPTLGWVHSRRRQGCCTLAVKEHVEEGSTFLRDAEVSPENLVDSGSSYGTRTGVLAGDNGVVSFVIWYALNF